MKGLKKQKENPEMKNRNSERKRGGKEGIDDFVDFCDWWVRGALLCIVNSVENAEAANQAKW